MLIAVLVVVLVVEVERLDQSYLVDYDLRLIVHCADHSPLVVDHHQR